LGFESGYPGSKWFENAVLAGDGGDGLPGATMDVIEKTPFRQMIFKWSGYDHSA
jgi:hypothetical protein